jgi:isocitrate dehydrogenase
MTKDLALLISPQQTWLTTSQFLDRLDSNLREAMERLN